MTSQGIPDEAHAPGLVTRKQYRAPLSSLSSDPSQLAGGGELSALGLVGDIAGSSEGVGLSAGTDETIGNTLSSLLSSGLLNNTKSMNTSHQIGV